MIELLAGAGYLLVVLLSMHGARLLRVRGPQWSVGEGLLAVMVLLWSSAAAALLFSHVATGEWSLAPGSILAPILGMAAAGLHVLLLLRIRVSWADLGFVPTARRWILLAVLMAVGFVVLSGLWGWLLQSLGRSAEQELITVVGEWEGVEALVVVLYGVSLAPLVEEALFRSALLLPLTRRIGARAGIGLTGVLFGLMHLSDPQAVPPLIVLGVGLGALRLASGSLWPPLVLHISNNLIAVLLTAPL